MVLLYCLFNTFKAPSQDKNPDWTLRRPVASPAFDILFSLMIPEPERFKPSWKIERAVQAYFELMLNSIKTLSHISIKSQVLYLSNLNLKPQFDSNNEYHYLTQNDLGLAINTGSQLSSHSTSNPAFNFLTYIPTSRHRLVKSNKCVGWALR